jgi:lipoyl-dependent peroxiredoxin
MKVLYTAEAVASDAGRNGRTRTTDGTLDFQLTMPESMGGPGGEGTNPEQLFAAGYAACFANALLSAARKERLDETATQGAQVTAQVDIGRQDQGFMGLGVRLLTVLPNLSQADAEHLVEKGHERCPYSRATRGNIEVELVTEGGLG